MGKSMNRRNLGFMEIHWHLKSMEYHWMSNFGRHVPQLLRPGGISHPF